MSLGGLAAARFSHLLSWQWLDGVLWSPTFANVMMDQQTAERSARVWFQRERQNGKCGPG